LTITIDIGTMEEWHVEVEPSGIAQYSTIPIFQNEVNEANVK
jgi:hypothetical protein